MQDITTQGLFSNFGWEFWQNPPCSSDLVPSYFQVFDNPKEHLCEKEQSPGLDSCSMLTLGQILYRQSIKRTTFRQTSTETGKLCREIVWCMRVILYCSALNNKVFLDLRCSSVIYFLNTISSLSLQGQNNSFGKMLKWLSATRIYERIKEINKYFLLLTL